MVATIDGKILSGGRDETVNDLGSSVDHQLMKRLEASADGVLVGAGALRATSTAWNPGAAKRFVTSRSGNLPKDAAFFGKESYVVSSSSASISLPPNARLLTAGKEELDFKLLLSLIKGLGVERLLVLGGADLNGQLIRNDLVDELFLTIAPKVKLGDDVPTYAGGEPLPRSEIQRYKLVEHHAVHDELFLRYRREHTK